MIRLAPLPQRVMMCVAQGAAMLPGTSKPNGR
jgi:hypothetical protein